MSIFTNISLLFCLLILSSCLSKKYYFESSERQEEIEIIPLLRMYKYSCTDGIDKLKHKGPLEINNSIYTLIFPTNFDEKILSPFPQNIIFIDSSSVNYDLKPTVSIQLKSIIDKTEIYGFVQILENNVVITSYKSSRKGIVEFQNESNILIARIFSFQTLKSDIILNGWNNYEITVFLADKSTGSWNGSYPEVLERKNYPRLKLKLKENDLKCIGSTSKTYIRK